MIATLKFVFTIIILSFSLTRIFSQPFIKAGGPFEISETSATPIQLQNNSKIVDFIEKELKYPRQALRMGVQGVVTVIFTVTNEGTVKDIIITRDIGTDCRNSVIDIISQTSGKWTFENKAIQSHTLIMWVSFNLMYGQTAKSLEYMKLKGLESYEQGKFKKAIVQFDNYLENYTYDPEIILKRAESCHKTGNNNQACKDLTLLRLMGELRDMKMAESICGH